MLGSEGGVMKSPGIFYNADIRNNGTARRVTEAFYQMGFKETGMERYSRPFHDKVDFGKHDFWLFVDDGRDEIPMVVPEGDAPKCCYLVDTHLGYEQRLDWARHFDYVFVAQQPTVAKMKADGVENVHWLPLACTPTVDLTAGELLRAPKDQIGPYGLNKRHDVVFVGYLNTGWWENGVKTGNNRIEALDTIFNAFPNSWMAFNCFLVDAAIRYARGRIGFNVSIKDDLNMRFFETMSYGVCLVANTDVVGWEELGFVEGEHFLGWRDLDEAKDKIKWALGHPMEREKIAKAGHELVRSQHTYQNRVEQMLSVVATGA